MINFIELTYRKDMAGKEKKFLLNPMYIISMTHYVNERGNSTKLVLYGEQRTSTEVEETIEEILEKIKGG